LRKNNINFEQQYKFDDCKYKYKLKFDFFLKDYNLCIEFDGLQHYKQIKRFGGADGFAKTKIKDKIKNNYCLKNNIKMIRIKYNENIFKKLKKIFKSYNLNIIYHL